MTTSISIASIEIAVEFTGGPGNPRDFVGLYYPQTPDSNYLTWVYLANDAQNPRPVTGVVSGLVHLSIINPKATYELRFVSVTDSPTGVKIFTQIGKSGPFTFGAFPTGVTFGPP